MSEFCVKVKDGKFKDRYRAICSRCKKVVHLKFEIRYEFFCSVCKKISAKKKKRELKRIKKVVNEHIYFDKRKYNCLNYPECLDEAAKLDLDLICKECKKEKKE